MFNSHWDVCVCVCVCVFVCVCVCVCTYEIQKIKIKNKNKNKNSDVLERTKNNFIKKKYFFYLCSNGDVWKYIYYRQ